jgi:hypothetical protein
MNNFLSFLPLFTLPIVICMFLLCILFLFPHNSYFIFHSSSCQREQVPSLYKHSRPITAPQAVVNEGSAVRLKLKRRKSLANSVRFFRLENFSLPPQLRSRMRYVLFSINLHLHTGLREWVVQAWVFH